MGILNGIIKVVRKINDIDNANREKRKEKKRLFDLAFNQAKAQELGRLKAQEIDKNRFRLTGSGDMRNAW